jgi:hypothetical protein
MHMQKDAMYITTCPSGLKMQGQIGDTTTMLIMVRKFRKQM